MGKETITLDNFADYHGVVGDVEIVSDLPLEPYIPGSDINIHLGRVARAARFAHLGSLEFTRYTKSQDQAYPDVAGMHEDGTATATHAATASCTSRIDPSLHIPGLIDYWNEGEASIKINFGHEELDDAKLREAKPWAQHIDRAMSEGLRWQSNRKLMRTNLDSRLLASAGGTIFPLVQAVTLSLESAAFSYGLGFCLYNGLFVGTGSSFMNYYAKRNKSDRRFKGEYSLTPGIPFDRLGFVHAYTRVRRFAEVK